MASTRTWKPDLPPAFVARYYANQTGKGLLGNVAGSILDADTPMTSEEQRHSRFGAYWAWWSSEDFQQRLDERRALGEV